MIRVRYNDHNTHWSAQIDGTKHSTSGDGNCGYNAFALVLDHMTPKRLLHADVAVSAKAVTTASLAIKQAEAQLKDSIEAAVEAEEQFSNMLERIKHEDPEKHAAIQQQIHADYLVALQLALSDLPDAQGEVTHDALGALSTSRTNHTKYVEEVAKELGVSADAGFSWPRLGA